MSAEDPNAGAAVDDGSTSRERAGAVPIVYTIRGCLACVKLLEKWDADGIAYEERRAELSQAVMDEARMHGSAVPIVVWPDGRVEQGFEGHIGCYII